MKIPALFSLPLILVGLCGLGGFLWNAQEEYRSEAEARALGGEITSQIVGGQPLGEAVFKNFTAAAVRRVGYVAVVNFRNGYRSGVIDSAALETGARELTEFRRRNGDAQTLAHLVQPGKGFAGEYLDVVSVAFVPSKEFSDRTPIGMLKIGYVVPGYPFGRGYRNLWWVLLSVGVVLAAAGAAWSRSRKTPADPPGVLGEPVVGEAQEAHSLEWLERQLERQMRVEVDDLGRSWHVIFDGESLEGWRSRGNWYVSDEELVGQPWGASIVHERTRTTGTYSFQASARKISGADGFILLFECGEHSLAWVLGGWNNTRSEVAGYDGTRTATTVPANEWVDLEICVGAERLEGFVNHRKVWELSRKDVVRSSPETGFERGLGVALWNTLVRFRGLRVMVS